MPAPLPASDLYAHLGFWMRMVSNHVSHAFAGKLADRKVTVAEWAVMRALYGEVPTAPSRLAEQMGLTRGAISKLAERLIAKALLIREADANDARTHTLALTNKARQLVPELAALADRNDEEFFDCLTERERAELERLLKRIVVRNHLTATPIE